MNIQGGASASGFTDELRSASMKLHNKDQSSEGTKEPNPLPFRKWNPTMEGYLQFLVDSKAVFAALETAVKAGEEEVEGAGEGQRNPNHPAWFAELTNTGLERSNKLDADFTWFEEQGYVVPELSSATTTYVLYLKELAASDPPAFLCHYYNVYFGHSKGGRMIARKVARDLLNGKQLEFYKWDDHLPNLLQGLRNKLNSVARDWSQEQKHHCLQETDKAFMYYGKIFEWIRS